MDGQREPLLPPGLCHPGCVIITKAMLGKEARTTARQKTLFCSQGNATKAGGSECFQSRLAELQPCCRGGPGAAGKRGKKDPVQCGAVPCPSCLHKNINSFFAGEWGRQFVFFFCGFFFFFPLSPTSSLGEKKKKKINTNLKSGGAKAERGGGGRLAARAPRGGERGAPPGCSARRARGQRRASPAGGRLRTAPLRTAPLRSGDMEAVDQVRGKPGGGGLGLGLGGGGKARSGGGSDSFFSAPQLASAGTFRVVKEPLAFLRVLEWVSPREGVG